MHRACLIFHYIWGIKSAVWLYLTVGSGILHRNQGRRGPKILVCRVLCGRHCEQQCMHTEYRHSKTAFFFKNNRIILQKDITTLAAWCVLVPFLTFILETKQWRKLCCCLLTSVVGFLVLFFFFCLVSLASLTVGLQCYSEQCSLSIVFLLVAVGVWLGFLCALLEQSVFFVVLLLDTALKSPPPPPSPPPIWFYCCPGR